MPDNKDLKNSNMLLVEVSGGVAYVYSPTPQKYVFIDRDDQANPVILESIASQDYYNKVCKDIVTGV
jgi:hypothetical protein